jgi:hypothetical protein
MMKIELRMMIVVGMNLNHPLKIQMRQFPIGANPNCANHPSNRPASCDGERIESLQSGQAQTSQIPRELTKQTINSSNTFKMNFHHAEGLMANERSSQFEVLCSTKQKILMSEYD